MISDTLLVPTADKGENMNDIFFIVEDAPEGGHTAKALGESIDNVRTILRNFTPTFRT